MVNKLPAGFQALLRQGKIAMDVLEVLIRINELIPIHQDVRRKTFQLSTRQFLGFWQACACLARPDGIYGQPDLEKLLVMGLILFCYNASCTRPDLTALYGVMRQKLADDIVRRLTLDDKLLIQWLWMVVIDNWRLPNQLLSKWSFQLLVQLKSSSFAFISREEMHYCLAQFFLDGKFANRCETYMKYLVPN